MFTLSNKTGKYKLNSIIRSLLAVYKLLKIPKFSGLTSLAINHYIFITSYSYLSTELFWQKI